MKVAVNAISVKVCGTAVFWHQNKCIENVTCTWCIGVFGIHKKMLLDLVISMYLGNMGTTMHSIFEHVVG